MKERDGVRSSSRDDGSPFGSVPSGKRVDVYEVDQGSLAEHAAALPAEAPPSRFRDVEEIAVLDKRRGTLAALIPIWGLWHLRRSADHSLGEKLRIGAASLLLTISIAAAGISLVPTEAERLDATEGRISEQIEVLHGIVEERRAERGEAIRPEEWSAAARAADLRFYDPWGRIYVYEPDGDGYRIGTLGQDGRPEGEGADRDRFVRFKAPDASQRSSRQ